MSRPRVVLLDKLTMGLAPQIVDLVLDAVQRINQEGVSVVIVEQNAFRELDIAHLGFVHEFGAIAMQGAGRSLMEAPRVQSAYLGLEPVAA